MNLGAALLPGCQGILCFINIILQLVSLPPSHWGTYEARTDFGTALERGHFGLWTICSAHVPFYFEDCDTPVTYLTLTALSTAAGSLAVIHLLFLLSYLPLAVIRIVQLLRSLDEGCFDARFMCLTKITVAGIALILAVLVVVLGSMGTEQPKYYHVQRGWAFWVQVVILVVDIFLVLLCSLENIQFWKLQTLRDNATSSSYRDDFSETYSNPNFGREPPYDPEPNLDSNQNGSTAALPPPPPLPPEDEVPEDNDNRVNNDGILSSGSRTVIAVNGNDLTYQNPTFEESSPNEERRRVNVEPRYGNI